MVSINGRCTSLEANRVAEEWGHPLLDDGIWEAAKHTANPYPRFYADLFARLAYPPPPTSGLGAIERIYSSEATPELIGLLRQAVSLGTEFKFTVDPLGREASDFLAMREEVLQERGNACERCVASL